MINYEDFAKLDIRVGTILSAERVPKTDKLIKLRIDIGETTPRQVVAGIAEYISDPEELVGEQLTFLANLEPRSIRGIESQGMILAVSTELPSDKGGKTFSLLQPAQKIPNGTKVR